MTKKPLPKVAARLRHLLSQRPDLSAQGVLGERIGRSQNAVSRWMTGKSQPRAEDIEKLCDVFECSADYLIGRNDFIHGLAPDSFLVDLDVYEKLPPDKEWAAKVPRRPKIVDFEEWQRMRDDVASRGKQRRKKGQEEGE